MPDSPQRFVTRLFAEHYANLVAFFLRRVRTKSEAPDLAQEVYLRMLRVRDIDSIRNPQAYLFQVASNLAKEQAVLDQNLARHADIDSVNAEQLQELPCMAEELDGEKRQARLRAVLTQLSPDCREAVVLHYHHGASCQEVADRLGISIFMVKKHIAQALVHCRRRMSRLA